MPSAEVEAKTIARPAGNGMGNGLFAATNITMGQEVLRIQKPFAAVLDSPRLQDTCSGCFGIRRLQRNQGSGSGAIHDDVAELKACTRCQVVRYCDKVCRFHVTFIISLSPPLTFVLFAVVFFYRLLPPSCVRGL
jgi:SET and MYND domain-containing protein